MAVRIPVAAPHGLRRLFGTSSTSTSTFFPSPAMGAGPSTSLFVTGLSKHTTTERLREAFSQFGEVVRARVMIDRLSGCSKGFGCVKYATIEEAAKGIEGMDGKFLDGWVIFAQYHRQRRQRQPPGHSVNHEPRTRTGYTSQHSWPKKGKRKQNRTE